MTLALPFFHAVAFLTRLPLPSFVFQAQTDPYTKTDTVSCYPLVGLLIGVLLAALARSV